MASNQQSAKTTEAEHEPAPILQQMAFSPAFCLCHH